SEESGARGLRASGRAVRAAGGGTLAAAEPEHDAALPGELCAAECAAGGAADGRTGDRAGRRRRTASSLRPGGARLGARGGDRFILALQPGPVRPVADRADGAPLPASAGGGGGRCEPGGWRSGVAGGEGEATDTGGVERDGPGDAGGDAGGVIRGAGAKKAWRDGGGLRRTVAELSRIE